MLAMNCDAAIPRKESQEPEANDNNTIHKQKKNKAIKSDVESNKKRIANNNKDKQVLHTKKSVFSVQYPQ